MEKHVISTVFFENKGLLKVTTSHVHCKCGNILEMVPDRAIVSTDH